MSKIMTELCNAAEIDKKRGEDEQDFFLRLALAVNKLPDAEWNKLTQKAQDWVNNASDATNAKKDIPGFDEEEKPETSSRRRVSDDGDKDKAYEPKLKDDVNLTTKRGKVVAGKIVEMDKEVVVLKTTSGEEEEFSRDRIEKIEPLGGSKSREDDAPKDPVKGDTVTVTTKRGKVVTGELVEMDSEVIVLKVDGAEEEFSKDRVESMTMAGKRKADSESGTTRRRSSDDGDKGDAKNKDKEGDGKRTRATNEKGVSVGSRIRELIVEDMDAKMEAIGAQLKKEGIDFRENTLQLNYADAHKMIDLLKKAKKLK